MVETDFSARGVPWVRLLLERREVPSTLNLGWRERASAAASVGAVVLLARGRPALAAATALSLVPLNAPFYCLLRRRLGSVRGAGLRPSPRRPPRRRCGRRSRRPRDRAPRAARVVIAAVVFDLDGVLVDTEHLWDEVPRAAGPRLGRCVHRRVPAGDDGHELDRVVALPPRERRAAGVARGDQRGGRPPDARPVRDRPARDRRCGGGRPATRRHGPAARRRLVLEPAADRRRARSPRRRRRLRGDRLVRGGRARQAVARRLPRGRAPARRRPGRVCRRRGLVERAPRRERGRDAGRRVPQPEVPARRRRARRSPPA